VCVLPGSTINMTAGIIRLRLLSWSGGLGRRVRPKYLSATMIFGAPGAYWGYLYCLRSRG